MNVGEAWAWILNIMMVSIVAWVLTKITLEALEILTDWIQRDRVEDFPGHDETGLSRKTWDRQPREYKERFWRETKERECDN